MCGSVDASRLITMSDFGIPHHNVIQHLSHSCVYRRCKLKYSIGVAVGFIICSCVLLVNDGTRENYSQNFKYVPAGSKLSGAMNLAVK